MPRNPRCVVINSSDNILIHKKIIFTLREARRHSVTGRKAGIPCPFSDAQDKTVINKVTGSVETLPQWIGAALQEEAQSLEERWIQGSLRGRRYQENEITVV